MVVFRQGRRNSKTAYRVIEQIEPDLTLDGLRLLAERNPAPTLTREKTRLIEND